MKNLQLMKRYDVQINVRKYESFPSGQPATETWECQVTVDGWFIARSAGPTEHAAVALALESLESNFLVPTEQRFR